jgi:hypothetical protein
MCKITFLKIGSKSIIQMNREKTRTIEEKIEVFVSNVKSSITEE